MEASVERRLVCIWIEINGQLQSRWFVVSVIGVEPFAIPEEEQERAVRPGPFSLYSNP